MSNLHNEQQLENIHHQLLEQDRKGLIDDEINIIARNYGLHADDDRDEIINFLAEFILHDINTAQEDKLTGKGSAPRPFAVDKKTFNDNFDKIFSKRERKQITEVSIEFTMPGYPSIKEMRDQVEKMHKEDKIVFTTTTKYI